MSIGRPRVALDGRSLQDRPLGGVGRSIQGQLAALAESVSLDVLSDGRMPRPLGVPDGVPVHSLRGPFSARGYAWLQMAATRWLDKYDGLFHCPFYGLPYRQPVPMVVTIHDLSFEFAPQWFPVGNRFVFQRQARWAARTARRILVHSDHVRSSVLERYGRYGVTDDRVLTVRMPVDASFTVEAPGWPLIVERLGLKQPYVVALGGAQRRRLRTAVEAWGYARETLDAAPTDLPLVVVGTEPPAAGEGVVYAGVLDDDAWAAVLRGASAFCYATGYEGYGMPAIEAAASGTPVVCARVGSLPELLGPAAAWSEGESARELGAALAEVVRNPQFSARLRAAGVQRTQALPTWTDVAASTVRAYHESLAPDSRRR